MPLPSICLSIHACAYVRVCVCVYACVYVSLFSFPRAQVGSCPPRSLPLQACIYVLWTLTTRTRQARLHNKHEPKPKPATIKDRAYVYSHVSVHIGLKTLQRASNARSQGPAGHRPPLAAAAGKPARMELRYLHRPWQLGEDPKSRGLGQRRLRARRSRGPLQCLDNSEESPVETPRLKRRA